MAKLLGGTTVYGTLSASGIIYDATNNSSQWDSTYSTVYGLSGGWGSGGGASISSAVSGNWQSTYITVSSLSAGWGFSLTQPSNSYLTIQQFAASNPTYLVKGNTVELYNGRVYVLAGNDPTNPLNYLAVNLNPHTPIFVTVPLSAGNQLLIDSFPVSNFRTAKYSIQIENNFDTSIYYSELNVVSDTINQIAIASEYGQVASGNIVFYSATLVSNYVNLYINYSNISSPSNYVYYVKGLRTNYYQI